MRRRALAGAAALLAAALALPAVAQAHGLVGRLDLPIPTWLFGWAAAIVLVVSFAALAVLWPKPRLQEIRSRRLFALGPWTDVVGGAFGVLCFGVTVYAGLAGAQVALNNLAPTVVYVLFWVGFIVASALFGDVFRVLSPWRAIARAVAFAARRFGSGTGPDPLPYPERLGRWPAAVGILAFAWLELAYVNRDDPSTLAILALVYASVQLVGMSLYGIEEWSTRADPFGVYFGLFARVSPLERRDGVVYWRVPLSGVPSLDMVPGTIALLCVGIGTTTFDGFSQSSLWSSAGTSLAKAVKGLGVGFDASFETASTIGLVGCVLLVGAFYWTGVRGMKGVGGGFDTVTLGQRFAHTLVPIAIAYAVAHYFSLLIYQGQATAALISDPLGHGSNLFGTAHSTIDYGVISATGIWYVQVATLVTGHVSGLVLAHDRAVAMYDKVRLATRSQYWMLLVMIGFTSLGLWLLSAINGQ